VARGSPADAGTAGRAGRVLPRSGGRVPRLVRGLAWPAQLHVVQRSVPLRPGGRLRLLLGAGAARLREAAMPHRADRAAERRLLHLGSAVPPVDVHPAGRDDEGRGGARLQPADPAAPAARLRRSRLGRLQLRLLPRPRRGPGEVLSRVPGVPDLHPARQGGLRLDRGARLPGSRAGPRPGAFPDRLRQVVRTRPGLPGRAGAGTGRPGHPQAPRRDRPARGR
jgi:hypothetical protein